MITLQEPINQVSARQNLMIELRNKEPTNEEGATPASIDDSSATPILIFDATLTSNSGATPTPTSNSEIPYYINKGWKVARI
jgi:hypothetical protein